MLVKSCLLWISLAILALSTARATPHRYPWHTGHRDSRTLVTRIPDPDGFLRVTVSSPVDNAQI